MGTLLGLFLGVGLLLVLLAATDDGSSRTSTRERTATERIHELMVQAGVGGITPIRLASSCAGIGLTAGVVMLVVSKSVAIAAVFAAMAGYAPIAVLRRRRRQRQHELREQWPDVVDNLTSSIRAGLSLSEALEQIGERGPEVLRDSFAQFSSDYRVSGQFGASLDRLKDSMADPVGDRVVEALRVARDVGGSDLGRLLRTLSTFLREEARTRGELESRQSWTVNGARLAVAAPWVLLALLSLRPEAVRAYDSSTGVVVLVVGAGVCVAAYRTMLRIGRLPEEQRVLR